MTQPDSFYIGNEYFFVENEERFAMILEDKLGHEAAEYFRDVLKNLPDPSDPYAFCHGECDKVYQAQQDYSQALSDVKESLLEIDVLDMTKKEIQAAINTIIRNVRNAEI